MLDGHSGAPVNAIARLRGNVIDWPTLELELIGAESVGCIVPCTTSSLPRGQQTGEGRRKNRRTKRGESEIHQRYQMFRVTSPSYSCTPLQLVHPTN